MKRKSRSRAMLNHIRTLLANPASGPTSSRAKLSQDIPGPVLSMLGLNNSTTETDASTIQILWAPFSLAGMPTVEVICPLHVTVVAIYSGAAPADFNDWPTLSIAVDGVPVHSGPLHGSSVSPHETFVISMSPRWMVPDSGNHSFDLSASVSSVIGDGTLACTWTLDVSLGPLLPNKSLILPIPL